MFKVKTINAISPVYRDYLSEKDYCVAADVDSPDAIIVRSADLHNMEMPSSLKAIARAGAGYNNIPVEECAKQGIVVFNTPGANANAVKELAIAALLLSSRDIAGGIEWCKSLSGKGAEVSKLVESGKKQFVGPEIAGKVLGVIGLGEIGALVANAGKGMDMTVVGYDPYISVEHAWKLSRSIGRLKSQDELLAESDYVSVHIPLMEQTRGMFNQATIAKMKRGATLINLSRGELVVAKDVLAALESGQLRAYVTDFPSDEIIGHKGVVAIPHLGASTPESEDNCVIMASRQIDAYLRNGSIKNSVNYPDCELSEVSRHRIAVMHANVPNMVGQITSSVASQGINIDSMVNKSRGQFAYTVLDLDANYDENLTERVRALEGVYGVRCF